MSKAALLACCVAATLGTVLAATHEPGPAAAAGGIAVPPSCAALNPGGTVNTPDPVRAGPAAPLPDSWPEAAPGQAPKQVHLRSSTETFNRLYEFSLAAGGLFAHRRGGAEPWRAVPLPDCLAGNLTGISADDDEMVALDRERRIYTMDNALKDPATWNWTSRWGRPLWTGSGFAVPADAREWSWSVISPAEDETWTDPAGNRTPVGTYKVSHIWGLRGRRLTFWDPWLPLDNSYEMCGPHRSRFRPVNLSASGSHVFVVGRHGDMFTRLYDFDISGHDPIFFDYSFEDQRGKGDGAPIQLPAEPWTRQPKIHGKITSAISISKFGLDGIHGRLRVEGRQHGKTGYWQRDLAAPRAKGWSFHPTGERLAGEVLDNPPGNTSLVGLGPGEDMRFVMKGDGVRAVIPDFNTYCSPAHVELHADGGVRRLVLHHVDGLRQAERARGLDDEPRAQYGAIRWPSGKLQEVSLEATRDRIVVPELGWTFTSSGQAP